MMQLETAVQVKTILIAAIGGQGGNVLVEWLFNAANLAEPKMRAEAIALPGLSQRGGGTTYYLEIASPAPGKNDPQALKQALEQVVFSQHPFPGMVDIIIGQELVELGRVLRGGYASRRTSVVASTYRNYTIGEKMPAFDGVFPSEDIEKMAATLAGQVALLDVPALAAANGLGDLASNAIMLGVLSALPGALPFDAETCIKAIRQFGLAVDMNLKAFEVGRTYQLEMQKAAHLPLSTPQPAMSSHYFSPVATFPAENRTTERASSEQPPMAGQKAGQSKVIIPLQRKAAKVVPDVAKTVEQRAEALKLGYRAAFKKLAAQMQSEFDSALHYTLTEALYQTIDYQNPGYGTRFLKLVKTVYALDNAEYGYKLTQTFAKNLAMRMTYEDAVRVAVLKTRPSRFERIRRDMGVKNEQVLLLTDYLKPDAAEIYGIMPYALVAPFLAVVKGVGLGHALEKFYLEQRPRTNSFRGFLTFKFLTCFEPLRPISHRAHSEWKVIDRYVKQVAEYAAKDYELALVVAESGKLVKGYGATRRKAFAATEAFTAKVLAPLEKWEARAKDAVDDNTSRYPVTVKTARAAINLLGRDEDGPQRAEKLALQVLEAAKNKMPRQQLLVEVQGWARALR